SYAGVEDYIAYYTRSQAVRDYLDLISEAREKAGIPVIASIHCSGIDTWVEFARDIQDAGADALELNIFILPSDIRETDAEVLQRYHAIIDAVKQHTHLPIALKLHHYFTGMANTLSMLAERSEALVLFNRFFNPEINIDTLSVGSSGSFSTPDENGLVQRWIGILRPHLQSSLAATTGIHDGPAVVRNLLAGANVVQVASAIYSKGPEVITQMNHFLKEWMEKSGNSRLDDFIGKLSYSGIPNPALYERAQFMKYFSGLNR
ncbi:MAG: diguanylate cyclase, partial [Bacteroidales bacterium]|nr:diguanylate cyclase [Bacteroidales bacterium]